MMALAAIVAIWAGRQAWQWRDGHPVAQLLRLAERDPAQETRYWRQALELRPRTWEAMLGLALEAEGRGDVAGARQWLDRARGVNRMYGAIWARASFLARHGEVASFWQEAREAFQMSHRERQALLALCWRMEPDGTRLAREIAGLRPPVLFDVTQFLMVHDLAAARLAYARLLGRPYLSLSETNAGRVATAEERRGLGLDLCDLDLDRGNRAEAWETWQRMGEANEGGRRLVGMASGRCFDWRPARGGLHGVDAAAAGPQWVLTFSGEQRAGVVLWRHRPPRGGALPGGMPEVLRARVEGDGVLLEGTAGFRGTVQVEAEPR